MVIVPTLPIVSDAFIERAQNSSAHFVFGPRSGAKTDELTFAPQLAPGTLQQLIGVKVLSVETLRADCQEPLNFNGSDYASNRWREELEVGNDIDVIAHYENDLPAVAQNSKATYVATLASGEFLGALFKVLAQKLEITTYQLAEDLRFSRRGNFGVLFNYSDKPQTFSLDQQVTYVLGSENVEAYSVSVFKFD